MADCVATFPARLSIIADPDSYAVSHPTVGVAFLRPKISDQLIEFVFLGTTSYGETFTHIYIRFRTSAYKCRSGGANKFHSSIVSGEILSS